MFKIKDEKVLSEAIDNLFEVYNESKSTEKLLEKCKNLIKDDNSTPEIIEKCIIFLNLIIENSEKNLFLKTKSHSSLLKNCLINIPLQLLLQKRKLLNGKDKNDYDKYIFTGNTTISDLKIIFGSLYDLPPNKVCFSLSEEYLNKIKDIENLENKKKYKSDLDETNSNDSLYELLLLKNNLVLI